ncbi:hypothetical protein VZT92_020198 [Zoarces viviparus]|uniref:Testis-expressed sequence 12 protein n=1 Tax=Zoarces viviparus TaxID=48416 RepID=A0AAW1EDR0_ZOAVI
MAEKTIPLILNKRPANKTECTPANQEKSPKKRKSLSAPSAVESADVFQAAAADATRDVSMLFSKFAEMLSEIAAADSDQMKQLESILTEAQNLESYLKENKKHLRQTLSQIFDKLHE